MIVNICIFCIPFCVICDLHDFPNEIGGKERQTGFEPATFSLGN